MENLNTALLLMVVGMATVFAILLIVIYLGNMHPKRSLLPNRRQVVLLLFPLMLWQLSARQLR